MLSNVYLFTGEETYLLDKELQRRKEWFFLKFGPESIFSFGLQNMNVSLIKQAIYSSGLFTTKKLIIINWLPLDTATKLNEEATEELSIFVESFIKAEGKIPEESLLVFVSSTPDKRGRLFRFLGGNASIKEFEQLKGYALEGFVKEQLSEWSIDRSLIQYFLSKVGSDLYRIWFECDKLKTWASITQQKKIDETMIDLVVFGQGQTDSFKLLSALFTDKIKAISILEAIHANGSDRNYFAGMLYWALKFYLFVLDIDESWIKDPKLASSILRMNPSQVKNEYARIWVLKANKKNIEIFYTGLAELDASIKSWKMPATYFWLGVKKLINELKN